MQANNLFIKWLAENLQRFTTKSPKFFIVWQFISGVLVAITGIPEFLGIFDIQLPELWSEKVNDAVAWASRGSLLISLMTTQSKPLAVTQSGEVIKKTNPELLPFTAAQEVKTAEKKDIPVVTNIDLEKV